jgi:hypothetical protein
MYMYIAYFVASLLIGIFGMRRKFGFWGYFFGSLFLSPLIGILLVISSDRRESEN